MEPTPSPEESSRDTESSLAPSPSPSPDTVESSAQPASKTARRQYRRGRKLYAGTQGRTVHLPLKTDTPTTLADKDALFVTWDGVLIHCKMTTKPTDDALTLVLMHGFSGSMSNFSVVWPELASDNQLIAFDRPGWGLSARVLPREDGTWPTDSGENPYTYEFSRKLLRGLLRHFELDDPDQHSLVLVGHSHGGATAASILCSDDELRTKVFRACVLIDAPLRAWPVPRTLARVSQKMPRFSKSLINGAAGLYRSCAYNPTFAGIPFYRFRKFVRENPDACVGWDYTFRVKGWRQAFVHWSIANAERATMDLTKLAEIPTLDIRGCNDRVIDPKDGTRCRPMTQADIAMVPQAGHLPFAEQPRLFMQYLNDFLDGIRVSHTYTL